MSNNFVEKIRAAVNDLSTEDEASWNKTDGKPSVERVRDHAKDPSITRADIEAAMPNVTRESVIAAAENEDGMGGEGNAAEEPQGQNAPTSKTPNETQQASENEPAASPSSEPETTQENAEESGKGESQVSEPDPDDDGMNVSAFVARGLLMAILLRLPNPMRVMADKTMLDDMADFVNAYTMHEERMVVVEMIKSIADTKMNEIPSGQYKSRVQSAMDVVRGDLDHIRTGVAPADDNKAAAARLAKLTGQSTAPAPGHSMPSALENADEEQKKAHARLYGEQG